MPLFNLTDLRAAPCPRPAPARAGSRQPHHRRGTVRCLADAGQPVSAAWRAGNCFRTRRRSRESPKSEGAGGLVVGLPLSLDGTAGPAAQAARDWTHALSEATGLPAALWDERLSSAAVNRFLIAEADMTRKRRAAVVDQMAAAYMLQAALDASRPG